MRSLSFTFTVAALICACVPTPPLTVVHVGKDGVKEEINGDAVKTRRPPSDTWTGVQGGAYIVRSNDDWQNMWKAGPETPAFPSTIDPLNEMLLLVATEDAIVSRLKITRVVETGELVTVFVRQTMLGEGCVRRSDERSGVDAVITPRREKPVKFVVEDEDGESCGAPPKTEIGCRLATAQSWSSNVTAKAGDLVECELSTVASGKYELVDQILSLTEAPPSSNAKLAFPKGPTRATIALDTFGTYAVRAEATDEAGRKGTATALIDVQPKKTRDVLVQLTWSGVDTTELTTPLPRVLLRVTQEGPRGQRCSAEVPVPGLCDAKTRGPYTYMKIPASRRKLPISLLYLDERAQEGPSPCVNVWFNGVRTESICDRDHRHAEDRWELGTLETWTGKVVAPKPPPEPKPAAGTKPAKANAKSGAAPMPAASAATGVPK